jgi:hypothetical protein
VYTFSFSVRRLWKDSPNKYPQTCIHCTEQYPAARSVRMDRDSVPLTLLNTTLSFVVYTPFGCEIPCYRVTAFDRSGLDSGHAPAFFVGALNLITRRVHLVDPGSSLCRVSPTIIGRRSVEARANLCRVVVCLLLPRLSSELDASRH